MPFPKKDSKNWYITFTEDGKQRTRSSGTPDYREAKRIENSLRAKDSKPVSVYSLDSVLYEYLSAKPSERAAYAAKQLIAQWSGLNLHDISPEMIARYKANRGVSDGTLKRELGVLRSAILHCNKELGWNLPRILDGRIPRGPKSRVRWITPEEAARLIDNSPQHLKDFITISLHTGLRKGELLSLTWDRVDLIKNQIRFNPEHHKSKTYASVPINEVAKGVFRRLTGQNSHVITFRGRPVKDIKKALKSACIKSGIENFTPHDLRHTCASWMVQARVPIAEVKEVLRHADISTTMIYAHLAPDNAKSAVDSLSAVVSAVVKCPQEAI